MPVIFSLRAAEAGAARISPTSRVCLAGTFNAWKPSAPLAFVDGEGVFRITMELPPGAFQYKYVIDGVTWVAAPSAPTVDDGAGRLNNLVVVAPQAANEEDF